MMTWGKFCGLYYTGGVGLDYHSSGGSVIVPSTKFPGRQLARCTTFRSALTVRVVSAGPLLSSSSGVRAATATVGVVVYAYQSNSRRCVSNCDDVDTAAVSAAYLFLGGGTQAVNNEEDEDGEDDVNEDDEDAGA